MYVVISSIDTDTIGIILKSAAVITAVGVLSAFIYKNIILPVKNLFIQAKSAWSAIQFIMADMKPNGGSSLRDAIDRIDRATSMSKERTHALVAALDLPVWESDDRGNCVWASPKLCDLWGLTQDEMKGYGWITGVAEKDREVVRTEWDRAVREKRRFSMVYNTVTGTKMLGHSICVKDGRENVIGHIGVLTNAVSNAK